MTSRVLNVVWMMQSFYSCPGHGDYKLWGKNVLTWKMMRYVCAHIAVLLTILQVWALTTANNTTDTNEGYHSSLQVNGSALPPRYHRLVKRCWNSVISGRPTLAKVVVFGTLFIFAALGSGLWLFCHIYRRHKREFAEIEEDLLAGRRCFKPQLEDLKIVFLTMHTPKPVTFMRKVISNKIRKRKVDEVEDEESEEDKEHEEDEENEEEDVQNGNENLENLTKPPGGLMKPMVRKTRKQVNDEVEPENESQVHGGDLRKPSKNELKGKAKAPKGKEPHKELAKINEKGEKSEKSDPTKKDITGKNLDLKKKGKSEQPDHKKKEASQKPDKSAVGKTMKDPRRKTEKPTKKEDKNEKREQKPKAQKVTVKKQEAPKKVKTEKVTAIKPNKTKTKKATKEKNSKKKFGGFFNK